VTPSVAGPGVTHPSDATDKQYTITKIVAIAKRCNYTLQFEGSQLVDVGFITRLNAPAYRLNDSITDVSAIGEHLSVFLAKFVLRIRLDY